MDSYLHSSNEYVQALQSRVHPDTEPEDDRLLYRLGRYPSLLLTYELANVKADDEVSSLTSKCLHLGG